MEKKGTAALSRHRAGTAEFSRYTLPSLPSSLAALLLAIAGLAPVAGAAVQPAKAPASPTVPFSASPEVLAFIDAMHEQYGFDVDHLTRQFAAIHSNATVLRAIRPAAVPEQQRSWQRYRDRFVNDRRTRNGLRFWQENAAALARAEAIYGVPAPIIIAIIGVETEYGGNMGKFSVFEALATLAFDYPPRADFFRNELEQLLLLARENGVSPLDIKGSYAGAIGIPQFMPSSQRRYAVDFDGDDRVDLRASSTDAIGSVARFLHLHGWQSAAPVAVPVCVDGDPGALVAAGIKPTMPLSDLAAQGVVSAPQAASYGALPAALIDLATPGLPTEYWAGFDNFYVITRYNRSSFYAMSVFQLAETLREAREAQHE